MRLSLAFIISILSLWGVEAFVPLHRSFRPTDVPSIVSLEAADGKKKKRRRKQIPGAGVPSAAAPSVTQQAPAAKEAPGGEEVAALQKAASAPVVKEDVVTANEPPSKEDAKVDKSVIADVANFQFEPVDAITKGK